MKLGSILWGMLLAGCLGTGQDTEEAASRLAVCDYRCSDRSGNFDVYDCSDGTVQLDDRTGKEQGAMDCECLEGNDEACRRDNDQGGRIEQ